VQFGHGPLDGLYETADGWVCIVAPKDEHVDALGRVLGIDLIGDPRFASVEDRAQHPDALSSLLMGAFATRSNAEVIEALRDARVPVAEPLPYNNVNFLRDPENRRTGRVAERPHETRGQIRELAVLVRVSDAQTKPHRLAPGLGEHTDEILREFGRSDADIAALRERHVVGGGENQ
jgi:crotonobetainyl-CoA:carnitine CoA-transferase CaiB-like acyl-CoA transferase